MSHQNEFDLKFKTKIDEIKLMKLNWWNLMSSESLKLSYYRRRS